MPAVAIDQSFDDLGYPIHSSVDMAMIRSRSASWTAGHFVEMREELRLGVSDEDLALRRKPPGEQLLMVVDVLAKVRVPRAHYGKAAPPAGFHDGAWTPVSYHDVGRANGVPQLFELEEVDRTTAARPGSASLDETIDGLDYFLLSSPVVEPCDEPVEGMMIRSDGNENRPGLDHSDPFVGDGVVELAHKTRPTTTPRG